MAVEEPVRKIRESKVLIDSEREAILRGNASRVLGGAV
jgi:hypothetical protein